MNQIPLPLALLSLFAGLALIYVLVGWVFWSRRK